jgi:hypothetical protein
VADPQPAELIRIERAHDRPRALPPAGIVTPGQLHEPLELLARQRDGPQLEQGAAERFEGRIGLVA